MVLAGLVPEKPKFLTVGCRDESVRKMELTMTNKKRSGSALVDPDLRMETELEADPILSFNEGRANALKIGVVILIAIAIAGVIVWVIGQT